ncbi:MAG TPA: hypothetical protein VJ824_08230 [Bacillota bacterium]|nr:hypothetical protein [Bacillota bacterium]
MNRKLLFIMGLLLAAALGSMLPQLIVGHVEGSTNNASYQFMNLGISTNVDREKVKQILDHVVGIEDYKIDPKLDRVTITFDAETMKAEWIAKSLEAGGYTPDEFNRVKQQQ